jgi:PIN domain nuclease of toxin-antitoxin system
VVGARLAGGLLSAANYAEVLTKSIDRGRTLADSVAQVGRLRLTVWPLDAEQAATAASLRAATRAQGLSLADRCCLALGLSKNLPVLTADREWQRLAVENLEVVLIR